VLRVTADSNIYISALNFGGLPDQILDLARSGVIQVAMSQAIVEEVSRVLRDKFGWKEDAIALAQTQISGFTERVEPSMRVDAVKEDPTDNRILECAAAANSDYLVTGDRHLLKLGRFGSARIVRPAEFLEIFGEMKGPS
jgi:putative PIN family toxin of toxin-antitoxin system